MTTFLDKYPPSMLFIALLFATKSLYLAFSVTPLWDIPDEAGHYAYVRDLAEGRGIPLLGISAIGDDITSLVIGDHPQQNYIAQHPPAYYLIAAIPLKIGSNLTNVDQTLFRLPRIIAALSGALSLLVLFRMLRKSGIEKPSAIALASAIGFIPMFSHLASGTNNDLTLFLFCALATFYFVSYMKQNKNTDAYWCAVWLAFAGITKMTAWILLAPMVLAIIFEFKCRGLKAWTKSAIFIVVTAVSLPAAWMLRNWLHFGNPFYTSVNEGEFSLAQPLPETFTDYLSQQPVLELFIRNFYGMIGWRGTGLGPAGMLQVHGIPSSLFAVILVVATAIIAIYVLCITFGNLNSTVKSKGSFASLSSLSFNNRYSSTFKHWLFLFCALASAYFIFYTSYASSNFSGYMYITAVSLLVFSCIIALSQVLYTTDSTDRVALLGLVIVFFFVTTILYQVYQLYILDGRLRGVQGRYFYPIVPLLLLCLSVAADRLRLPSWTVVLSVALLGFAELEAFLSQIIPFYAGGKL